MAYISNAPVTFGGCHHLGLCDCWEKKLKEIKKMKKKKSKQSTKSS